MALKKKKTQGFCNKYTSYGLVFLPIIKMYFQGAAAINLM